MLFQSHEGIGVHIGAESVEIVEGGSGQRRELSCMAGMEAGSLPGMETVSEIAKTVADMIGKRYVKVNVAIANPYLDSRIFSLDESIRDAEKLKQFLLWRFRDEFHVDVEDKICTYQHLGVKAGKQLVLAQLCDGTFVRRLDEAFLLKGIPLNLVDASYNILHNFLATEIEREMSIVLFLEKDYWVFALLDDELRPFSIKSGWMALNDSGDVQLAYREVLSRIGRHVSYCISKGIISDGQPMKRLLISSSFKDEGTNIFNNWHSISAPQLLSENAFNSAQGEGVFGRLLSKCQ